MTLGAARGFGQRRDDRADSRIVSEASKALRLSYFAVLVGCKLTSNPENIELAPLAGHCDLPEQDASERGDDRAGRHTPVTRVRNIVHALKDRESSAVHGRSTARHTHFLNLGDSAFRGESGHRRSPWIPLRSSATTWSRGRSPSESTHRPRVSLSKRPTRAANPISAALASNSHPLTGRAPHPPSPADRPTMTRSSTSTSNRSTARVRPTTRRRGATSPSRRCGGSRASSRRIPTRSTPST